MPVDYNFGFSNKKISDWFSDVPGSDTIVKEFKYLHDHPLVKPNFLTEIEMEIYKAGLVATDINLTGKPVQDLSKEAGTFTVALSGFIEGKTDAQATACLESLRRLLNISKYIQGLRRK